MFQQPMYHKQCAYLECKRSPNGFDTVAENALYCSPQCKEAAARQRRKVRAALQMGGNPQRFLSQDPAARAFTPESIKAELALLSTAGGREHMALIAAHAVRKGELKLSDVEVAVVGRVQELLQQEHIPEPVLETLLPSEGDVPHEVLFPDKKPKLVIVTESEQPKPRGPSAPLLPPED